MDWEDENKDWLIEVELVMKHGSVYVHIHLQHQWKTVELTLDISCIIACIYCIHCIFAVLFVLKCVAVSRMCFIFLSLHVYLCTLWPLFLSIAVRVQSNHVNDSLSMCIGEVNNNWREDVVPNKCIDFYWCDIFWSSSCVLRMC